GNGDHRGRCLEKGRLNMAPQALSLKRNVLYGLIGNFAFALTQWGIIAVVARLGSPEEVGAVTIATALVTPIFFLAAMSLREGHSVDDLTEFTPDHYYALILTNSLVAMGLISVLVATWYGGQGALVQLTTLGFMLVKFVGTQANMNYGVFQRAQRIDYVAISYVARGVLGLAGFAAIYASTGILWLAFAAEALMWFAAQWVFDQRFLTRLGARRSFARVLQVSPASLWKLFCWMLPLGLAGFFMNATASAPRLVLAQHVDLAQVGIFGAIAYINTALVTVSNAIGSASAARLRGAVRNGRRKAFMSLSVKLVALSSLIGASMIFAVWIAGPLMLRIFYGEYYADQKLFLLIITATAIWVAAAPLQFALTAGHAYWRRLGVSISAFTTTVVSALILVPEHGIYGAGMALLAGVGIRISLLGYFFLRLYQSIDGPQQAETGS
ncbi:MAG: lipopolysaccharide biosynthesis protein, partial [Mangrovicoccus sp.]|nr:lipopolysaccharide biosynthesis protein [Mangrovicoccus sp.]